ncbi:MAG: molybdopterin-dependent oxidoreductase [Thaumarchaeota archaeon]|nr:molybdopterin-dependent oxidoreductase [Nitrososphaerota archaeon]
MEIIRFVQSTVPENSNRIQVVRTACSLCANFCGLLVHTNNGKVVKIEGDPENPHSHGHVCAKGLSAHLNLYSPKRITRPLLRVNREKGLDVEPEWKEIGWEEAVDILTEKVRKIRANPKGFKFKTYLISFDLWSRYYGALMGWVEAMQAFYGSLSSPCFCGNAVNPHSYLNTGGFDTTPDAEYAKYILLIGAQAGSIVHYDTMNTAKRIAEKRPGNIRVVSVDPVCNFAASKAEEWIPIRPGTDGAFLLALVNLLVNEYGIYDAGFLKASTNAPYLIGEDGLYMRDAVTGKPLIWDSEDGTPKAFDDPTVNDYALEGSYSIDGVPCRPGFQLIKDYVKKYTPEFTSEATSIPVETIRRTAKEIGEAACIGQTITIDGVKMPYRPVSVVWYRGLSAHRHSYLAGMAAMMLPTLLGAIQVPGAIKSNPHAYEYVTEDGLMAVKIDIVKSSHWGGPYPPRPVTKPSRPDLLELFPVATFSRAMVIPTLLQPSKFGLNEDIVPDLMIVYRNNFVGNSYSPSMVVDAIKKIPYLVSVTSQMDETSRMADLVLPDLHHLERLAESVPLYVDEPGLWYAAKPTTKPPFEPPYDKIVAVDQIFLEVAKRAGFLDECYKALNKFWSLEGTGYELDPDAEYSYMDLIDRRLKSWLGPEKGIDWLMTADGGLISRSPKMNEIYRAMERKGRIHLYFEFMLRAGKEVDRLSKELGLSWDTSDYQPVPDWKPCSSYLKKGGEYDLFVTNFKVPMQIHGFGKSNPLLFDLVNRHGLDCVIMNPETAARKGIRDGDAVLIETVQGKKGKAVVRLSERVHPEVIGTIQHKVVQGADFNSLLTLDEETMDFVGCAVDSCLLAKVEKAAP